MRSKYYLSDWNVLDMLGNLTLLGVCLLDYFQQSPDLVRPLMAFNLLVFYFRLFYYFRLFKTTAPLVKAIIQISADAAIFIFVFMIGVFGFAMAFWIVSNHSYIRDEQFITSIWSASAYSYMIALGEFDTEGFRG